MAIDAQHPEYSERLPDWEQMIDTHEGQRAVKAKGEKYLPPTKGMRLAGYNASAPQDASVMKAYEDYKLRARFPPHVRHCVIGLIGTMHRKDAVIELPGSLQSLLDACTVEGEPALALLVRINEAQLVTSRIGLLLDPVDGGDASVPPRIATYGATTIRNWQTAINPATGTLQLTFLSLDESAPAMGDDYTWSAPRKRTRLCRLHEGVYQTALCYDGRPPAEADWRTPTQGGKTLNRIPFVVINLTDIQVMTPAVPHLLGLSDVSLSEYRQSADYEQHLHECAGSLLVGAGTNLLKEGVPLKVGPGSFQEIPKDAKLEYIGVSGAGLTEQREALQNTRTEAESLSANVADTKGAGIEAAETVRIRVSSRMASLSSIATAGAEGLVEILRIAADWMQKNRDEVKVVANYDFDATVPQLSEALQLWSLHTSGAPITRGDVYAKLQQWELVPADRTLDETDAIRDQEAMEGGTGAAKTDIDPLGGGDGAGGDDEMLMEGNPYKVMRRGDKFVVMKLDGGMVAGGMHDTEEEAMAHFRALESAWRKEHKT